MFVACGIWCLADVSSVSPSSEQTAKHQLNTISHRRQTYHINLEIRSLIHLCQSHVLSSFAHVCRFVGPLVLVVSVPTDNKWHSDCIVHILDIVSRMLHIPDLVSGHLFYHSNCRLYPPALLKICCWNVSNNGFSLVV